MKTCTFCKQVAPDEAIKCPYCGHEVIDPTAPKGSSDMPATPRSIPNTAPDVRIRDALRAAAERDMRVGGLWCLGGIVVTAVTYSAASGGGSYVIAWGAIVFGGIQFIRGVIASQKARD
jgi:hypothetical protein